MKVIKTVWNCGLGSKLDMRVRINWIPSGVSMGINLGLLILIPVGFFETISNDSRVWKFCGEKSTQMFNRNIGLLLRWLNIFNIRSCLKLARVSRIGIKPSACFVMRQLRSVIMRSVK